MKKIYVFFINVFILTLASLIIQTVNITFNVWLAKKIGAEGIGLYHLIMSVYGFSVTLATSGISLTVTRLVSEENALKNYSTVKRIMSLCLCYSFCFGIFSMLLLIFNANAIGTVLLNDIRSVECIKTLALSMPFISLSSALNGYFTALKHVIKTSVVQVFELIIRMCSVSILLSVLLPYGTAYACRAIFIGGVIGEISSFIFIFTLYIIQRKPYTTTTSNGLIKRIISISLPLAVSTYIRSTLNTAKQIIVPKGLQKSGLSYKASLSGYGIITGMVMPVITFPMNILYSCANLLIPELSEYAAKGNTYQIKRIVKKALLTTTAFAIMIFMICFAFHKTIALKIYNNNEAGRFIFILSPIILTMYIDAVADGMLKGLNQQLQSMKYNIIDSVISILLLYLLLPRFGIYGYIAVIYISEIINTTLSVQRLVKVVFK